MQHVFLNEIEPNCFRVSYYSDKVRHTQFVDFRSITSIVVFKRDIFSYDLICLQIWFGHEVVFELDEKDGAWTAFIEQLPLSVPGCLKWESWFSDVAFPAFKANTREIYRRIETDLPSLRTR